MTTLLKKINIKQRRPRRDLKSQAKVTCAECGLVSGTFKKVRGHIKMLHGLNSEIVCRQGTNCKFHCPHTLRCFTLHSLRVHSEFFNGKNTKFGNKKNSIS